MLPVGEILLAAWLGLLTSIYPCPLTTNIAAISFIAKSLARPRDILLSGLLYTLGRALVYVAIAAIVVGGLLGSAGLSMWLQTHMNRMLGPVLILVGMFMLELLSFGLGHPANGQSVARWGRRGGFWGAGLLGIIFALSFCPAADSIFFLGLLPLAVKFESPVLLPLVFGIATAIPVAIFAAVIAFGARRLGAVFNKLTAFQWWAQRVTGTIFILGGIYYCLHYIFDVL